MKTILGTNPPSTSQLISYFKQYEYLFLEKGDEKFKFMIGEITNVEWFYPTYYVERQSFHDNSSGIRIQRHYIDLRSHIKRHEEIIVHFGSMKEIIKILKEKNLLKEWLAFKLTNEKKDI